MDANVYLTIPLTSYLYRAGIQDADEDEESDDEDFFLSEPDVCVGGLKSTSEYW